MPILPPQLLFCEEFSSCRKQGIWSTGTGMGCMVFFRIILPENSNGPIACSLGRRRRRGTRWWRRRLKLSISWLRLGLNAGILSAATRGRVIHYSTRYGNAMTVCVHALYIAHVVTLLGDIPGAAPRPRANQASSQQAAARADGGACSSSNRRPRCGAKSCSYSSARHAAGGRSPVRRGTPCLLQRELPALVIICTKLFETFA
jgi:hypothetical protein